MTASATTPVQYGGFWRRLGAYVLVDFPVQIACGLVIGALIGCVVGLVGALAGVSDDGLDTLAQTVAAVAGFVMSWLYSAGLESSRLQATLGKKLFGMVVVDLAGQRVSFLRATGRHAAKFLSGLFFGLGFIMIGRNERRQGLHDDLAKTLVLRTGVAASAR